jgi:hypothetical protein
VSIGAQSLTPIGVEDCTPIHIRDLGLHLDADERMFAAETLLRYQIFQIVSGLARLLLRLRIAKGNALGYTKGFSLPRSQALTDPSHGIAATPALAGRRL